MSFLPAFTPIYSGTLISLPAPVGTVTLPVTSKALEDQKKIVNPFDPEAAVPLPFQLDDCLGPYGTSVWKRNERERYRVRCVNEGYEKLRLKLPLADGFPERRKFFKYFGFLEVFQHTLILHTLPLWVPITLDEIWWQKDRETVEEREKRISKVDTLRLAIRYIKHLDLTLRNEQHIYRCRCFHGFKEESEGNIQVAVRQL